FGAFTAFLAVLLGFPQELSAQSGTTYIWTNAGPGNSWDKTSWSVANKQPGAFGRNASKNTNIVQISSTLLPSGGVLNIPFNAATQKVLSLGTFDFQNAGALTLQNSGTSTQPGTLALYGATVNGVAGTLLNNQSGTLTISSVGPSGGTMGILLGATGVIQGGS